MQIVAGFLFIFVLRFCEANPLGTQDSKIIGGVETNIEDVPYQLQLESRKAFSCGAVIIDQEFVLTAGHCVFGYMPQAIKLISGNSNRGEGARHDATAVTVHPDYVDLGGYADYDIAVIRITPPFEFNDKTQPIKLIEAQPAAGANATVSGWGTISVSSVNLKRPMAETIPRSEYVINANTWTYFPRTDQKDCVNEYDGTASITDNMFCAGVPEGGKDACSGDSGGPLVVDGKLAGLVSWGHGCAVAGYAGVYTNVAPFGSWVQEQIDNLSNETILLL